MDDADRINRLEQAVVALNDELGNVRQRAYFAHVVAGQALSTLARLLPLLERSETIAAAEAGGITGVTHAILLQYEQNPAWHADDRASAKQWREQLGREG